MRKAQENKTVAAAHKVPTYGRPNSVFDRIGKDGIVISRRYYNNNGHPKADIDLTDHGNATMHPTVPHVHDWKYLNETVKRDKIDRSLTVAEEIANKDVLK